MPILWRYALQNYLRIFLLSVSAFIAVLIVARFNEIARFTALSGEFGKTGLFIVYQVPFILPIAIPISALIASLLLFRALSRSFELTALRSSGLSICAILSPVLFCSLLLSILNFSLCASISPFCRREGKMLLYCETSQNPLVLLQRQKLVKIKHAYLNMKVKNEETTKDLVLIFHNNSNQRLNLLLAKKLRVEGDELLGEDLSIVSYLHGEKGFDPLIIENQSSMTTAAPLLSVALKRNRPRLDINSLDLKMLWTKMKQNGWKAKSARIEIFRRISLSLAVFTFTFLGCAFGIETRRNPSGRSLLPALLLALLIFLVYLLGKGIQESLILAVHPLVWGCSLLRLRQISRGYA